jgi:isoamylase
MTLDELRCGTSFPLGATVQADGVNFSVFSKNATLVELLLFDSADAAAPARVIPLDPRAHRT